MIKAKLKIQDYLRTLDLWGNKKYVTKLPMPGQMY